MPSPIENAGCTSPLQQCQSGRSHSIVSTGSASVLLREHSTTTRHCTVHFVARFLTSQSLPLPIQIQLVSAALGVHQPVAPTSSLKHLANALVLISDSVIQAIHPSTDLINQPGLAVQLLVHVVCHRLPKASLLGQASPYSLGREHWLQQSSSSTTRVGRLLHSGWARFAFNSPSPPKIVSRSSSCRCHCHPPTNNLIHAELAEHLPSHSTDCSAAMGHSLPQ